jgi:hypothetical protein
MPKKRHGQWVGEAFPLPHQAYAGALPPWATVSRRNPPPASASWGANNGLRGKCKICTLPYTTADLAKHDYKCTRCKACLPRSININNHINNNIQGGKTDGAGLQEQLKAIAGRSPELDAACKMVAEAGATKPATDQSLAALEATCKRAKERSHRAAASKVAAEKAVEEASARLASAVAAMQEADAILAERVAKIGAAATKKPVLDVEAILAGSMPEISFGGLLTHKGEDILDDEDAKHLDAFVNEVNSALQAEITKLFSSVVRVAESKKAELDAEATRLVGKRRRTADTDPPAQGPTPNAGTTAGPTAAAVPPSSKVAPPPEDDEERIRRTLEAAVNEAKKAPGAA